MKQLSKALSFQAHKHGGEDKSDSHPLNKAGRAWADHALRTYSGELLRRALDISVAMNGFLDQLSIESQELFELECEPVQEDGARELA